MDETTEWQTTIRPEMYGRPLELLTDNDDADADVGSPYASQFCFFFFYLDDSVIALWNKTENKWNEMETGAKTRILYSLYLCVFTKKRNQQK